MSKATNKKSRKSKLTCRNYDTEENMAVFQTSTSNSSTMPNPKPILASSTLACDDFEALIDSQKKPKQVATPKFEFSVTVAVEDVDEDSSDLIIVETNEQTPIEILSSDSEAGDTVEDKNPKKKAKQNVIEPPEMFQGELVLDRNEIIDACNEILQNADNIPDKILSIEAKNCIGQYRTSFLDEFEAKLQSVLHKWLEWRKSVEMKLRSTPLFYKCYICEKSWWHYHDLREHLKGHDAFKLDLEKYTVHEANIVACSDVDTIIAKDFDTEGDCPKCGYGFEVHKLSFRKNGTYICNGDGCNRIFYTCSALNMHEFMFHTIGGSTGDVFERAKPVFCKICGYVFYTQKSYQSHLNLVHTVRSDLIAPVWLNKCPLCNEKYSLGVYHVCAEKKVRSPCRYCFRNFQWKCQYKAHMADHNSFCKCRVCDIRLPKRCIEAEHMMKHTEKFVFVKKCLLCEDFTVFWDFQTAFDHVSLHMNMAYEGSNYKNICKILIPKSCILKVLEPKMEKVKEEPTDVIITPEINIEQDVVDDFETDAGEEVKVQIKEEIDIHDDFETEHVKQELIQNTETNSDISRIFGIKIEASEMKQEMKVDEESEYEDDIIKLDFDFLNTMQESVEYSTQDCILKVETTSEGTKKETDEMEDGGQDTQEDEEYEDVDEEMLEENGNRKIKKPKIYKCGVCGLAATHREFRAHMKSHCDKKVYEVKVYTCTKCSINFEEFCMFINHFSEEHNLNPLSCPECFKSFKSYREIEVHIEKHIRMTYVAIRRESGAKNKVHFYYKCKICEKTIEKEGFFEHWVGHLTFIEKTEECPKTDDLDKEQVNDEMLNELLERIQNPLPVFNLRRGCPICVRHFDRKSDYKRHLIEHLLNHAFSLHYRYKHLKCQICHKGFYKPDEYKKHMRDHGGLRDHKCQICDKCFSDSSNYTKHMKVHNQNAYTCDICKKKFQAKFSLVKHIVIHNDQKPIICTLCDKPFFLESAYRKHCRMAHEKQHSYACRICKLRFSRIKDKWDHLWLVHKERKRKVDCPKCSGSYRKFSDLKTHMRTVHSTHIKNPVPPRKSRRESTQDGKKTAGYTRLYI